MSLTLDEVRNIKFRMAKRSGYEVLDVDEFVDQVEASFEQLLEENANLKRQVDSLKTTDAAPTAPQPVVQQSPAQQPPVQQPSVQQPPVQQPPAAEPKGERIIVTTASEASPAVVRLVQVSTEHAEQLVNEAEEEAQRIKSDAERNAKQLTTDATTRAERVESEARVNAERMRSEAQNNADRLNQDAESRRRELFGELEKQRDQLAGSVSELRKFESSFRQNLTSELRGHIDRLSAGKAEPASPPAVLDELGQNSQPNADGSAGNQQPGNQQPGNQQPGSQQPGSQQQGNPSETPRLDALLGEQS